MRPLFPRQAALAALLAGAFATAKARADEPATPGLSLEAARDLFVEAEKDEDAGRWGEALEKVRRVAEVKLTPGVRYHVALCEEHLGQLLSALDDYKTAATQARAENAPDVLRLVDARVADASLRVAHVVIALVPAVADADVRLDGQAVTPGVPIDADPGRHTVEASAPGCAPSFAVVTLPERETTPYEVHLEPDVAPAAAAPAQPEVRANEPAKARRIGLAAAMAAVALAGGGIGAYVEAGIEHADGVSACSHVVAASGSACDHERSSVRAWDWIAAGTWAAAAGLGAFSVITFAGAHRTSVAVGPASLRLEGSF